jgi:hypothetical protein
LSVTTRLIIEGPAYDIYEIVTNGRSYVEKFFKKLPKEERNRVVRLIEYIAVEGNPNNEEKYKRQEGDIYVIKRDQVRIYCFEDTGRVILLTHGAIKKQDKAYPQDLKRAKRLRKEYLAAKNH